MRLQISYGARISHVLRLIDGRERYLEIEASIRRSRIEDATLKLKGRQRRTLVSARTLLDDSMLELFSTDDY